MSVVCSFFSVFYVRTHTQAHTQTCAHARVHECGFAWNLTACSIAILIRYLPPVPRFDV